jgi:alpha-amylase
MKSICLYFQVHQPFRLRTYRFFDIGENHSYYDEYTNRFIMQRVAQKCYLPMNNLLLDLIKEFGSAFKVSFSISGLALEQFELYAPEVLESFKQLAKTGHVEFLSETYAHSLCSLNNKDEFIGQVEMHAAKIEEIFKQKPTTFRNTELVYSDEIGEMVADMGYDVMLTEGAKHVLGWRSPNMMYTNAINPKLKLLLKNFRLSDDIAFRFSLQSWPEWPLTTDKFTQWLNEIDKKDEVVNLFMDYETFGEHQWEETGIFDFMSALPEAIFKKTKYEFKTPAELGKELQPVAPIHVPYPISWADEERDLTAWLGNDLQNEAFEKLNSLRKKIPHITDENIQNDWRYLQASDHFYYMSTKWFSDGDVHSYFNPYQSPYEAFINYMNVLTDFATRLDKIYIDVQDELGDIKESVQKITKKTGKTLKKTVSKTSKKVKETIDKRKDMRFEDIKDMSDNALKKLLKEIDVEALTIALKDTKDEFTERVLPNLGVKARKKYEELQTELKKVKKSDIKKYQKDIENKLNELFKK